MVSHKPRKQLKKTLIREDRNVRIGIRNELRATGEDAVAHLRTVTRSWSNKPNFTPYLTVRPTYMSIEIVPGGRGKKIWRFVDEGTGKYGKKKRAYQIPKSPQPGRLLKFQANYSAKTAPVAKFNVGSGKKSGAWITKKTVMHPGIKPRHFIKTWFEKLRPPLGRRIDAAIKRMLGRQ